MVQRASLGPDGIFISRPGVDVNGATETDLLLSPDTPLLKVTQSGAVAAGGKVKPPEEWSWLSTSAFYTTTIGFGVAYPRPPIVLINLLHANGLALRPAGVLAGGVRRFGTFYSWYLPFAYADVRVDSVIVRTLYDQSQVPTIRYAVFDIGATP